MQHQVEVAGQRNSAQPGHQARHELLRVTNLHQGKFKRNRRQMKSQHEYCFVFFVIRLLERDCADWCGYMLHKAPGELVAGTVPTHRRTARRRPTPELKRIIANELCTK